MLRTAARGHAEDVVEQLIEQARIFLESHPDWVVAFAAMAAFGESLIVIGMFIPGTTLLVVIGGLAAGGLVDPLPAGLGAIAGAILGDTVTYYCGRLLGRGVLRWEPLQRYRRRIAEARLFFRKYGVWSVLIGRFFGPVRATIPLVAGAFGMRASLFQLANVLSALVWAPVVMAPGWLAARGLGQIAGLSADRWILAVLGGTLLLTVLGLLVMRWLMRPRR